LEKQVAHSRVLEKEAYLLKEVVKFADEET